MIKDISNFDDQIRRAILNVVGWNFYLQIKNESRLHNPTWILMWEIMTWNVLWDMKLKDQ
mgnify:CR=1 FL=1